jgi:hypothetical protein
MPPPALDAMATMRIRLTWASGLGHVQVLFLAMTI